MGTLDSTSPCPLAGIANQGSAQYCANQMGGFVNFDDTLKIEARRKVGHLFTYSTFNAIHIRSMW